MNEELHTQAAAAWRSPAGVSAWWESPRIPPELLQYRITGPWWDLLQQLQTTLIVSREYENFLLALNAPNGVPSQSWLPLPHPSGIAIDHRAATVHVACTRNPNQIVQLRPVNGHLLRDDSPRQPGAHGLLLPARSDFLPGCGYLHDIVLDGQRLLGTAVGLNAIVDLTDGRIQPLWWPEAIEKDGRPDFRRNHLQLNGIALRDGLSRAAFCASSGTVIPLKPGHADFPVDGTGVIFDAVTRQVAVTGLTRPHSVRFQGDTLWVNNSGYGQTGIADLHTGKFQPVLQLPGWTRGLCLTDSVAFIGTSRVLPRYRQYAPGLDPDQCCCGISAVDLVSGRTIARIEWPEGNQIFAIEPADSTVIAGLPVTSSTNDETLRTLFYSATTQTATEILETS